jgi:hypothetical protein
LSQRYHRIVASPLSQQKFNLTHPKRLISTSEILPASKQRQRAGGEKKQKCPAGSGALTDGSIYFEVGCF